MFRMIILALIAAMQVMPADARIVRSAAAKAAFAKLHPCPATHKPIPHCPGYVIDHVKPLCAGGADRPSNMQWQTIAVGKKKDSIERRTCAFSPSGPIKSRGQHSIGFFHPLSLSSRHAQTGDAR
jgi:hypothetical protein